MLHIMSPEKPRLDLLGMDDSRARQDRLQTRALKPEQ